MAYFVFNGLSKQLPPSGVSGVQTSTLTASDQTATLVGGFYVVSTSVDGFINPGATATSSTVPVWAKQPQTFFFPAGTVLHFIAASTSGNIWLTLLQ
jgi:hypothetical protein